MVVLVDWSGWLTAAEAKLTLGGATVKVGAPWITVEPLPTG